MKRSLRERTQELVISSGRSYRELAEAAGVDYVWLWRYVTGKVQTARGDDLQRVYEEVSGNKLEIN